VPAAVLAPKPQRLSHPESAALTLAGLSGWQGLFDHGALREGERVRVLGTKGGVGHLAVQLAGDALVGPDQPCELVFDTAGGDALAAAIGSAPRIVSVAEEADGVTYFIVEPNREQLIELAHRANAGELNATLDSTFALEDAAAAFARVAERNKKGKVILVTGA
jgi:NADPH:quinone reductase-like Zn-dependent oxidoreductase